MNLTKSKNTKKKKHPKNEPAPAEPQPNLNKTNNKHKKWGKPPARIQQQFPLKGNA